MPINDFDIQMMRRALRVATYGRGLVEPNPLVGCVLAKDNRIIAEGHHARYGGPHAEPAALANCTESPRGATAYVTLEPCCHTNKKTPPCVPALINAEIARVVVGCVDPNPDVNGKGLDLLRAAGIEVVSNVLEDEAKQLLAPFIANVVYNRPYITLKWAETADGKVAGPGGARLQISNSASARLVHHLRARTDAILVGINTILADDPLLTARDVEGARPLTRIILDSRLRTPLTAKVVSDRSARTIIYADPTTLRDRPRVAQLQQQGIEVRPLCDLEHLFSDEDPKPAHLLVEPGPTLARSFFDQPQLVDRVWVIRSPNRINDPTAPAATGVPGDFLRCAQLDLEGDTLTEYLNPTSPVFFAPEPPPDIVLHSSPRRGEAG